NLAEMRRASIHATALEPRLVEALSRANSRCEQLWREARPAADFARILPALRQGLGLVREAASAKAERLGVSPSAALPDRSGPARRPAESAALFAALAAFLPVFRARVMEHQAALPPPSLPEGPFRIEAQRALGERLMGVAGFDFAHGRLDTSLHPFCGGV